jgi:hypothetical protein
MLMKKHGSWARVLLAGVVASAGLPSAAHAAGPAGHWKGAIEVPGQPLQVEVDLAEKAGVWAGTITIPVQNLRAFPLSAVEAKGDAVSFAMKGIPGEPIFKGSVSADGVSLSGDFTQGGAKLPFQLKRTGEATITEAPKNPPVAKELEGEWEGSLNAGGKVLRLKLKLANHAEGGATGSLVSIDQGGAEFAITTIVQTAQQLKLELPAIGASYSGELKEGRLVGDWTHGGGTLPLAFARPKP